MCNTYFIKYITCSQSQMRVNGEFDEGKNLIEKRQVFPGVYKLEKGKRWN